MSSLQEIYYQASKYFVKTTRIVLKNSILIPTMVFLIFQGISYAVPPEYEFFLSEACIEENQPKGLRIGRYPIDYADEGDTFTYSLRRSGTDDDTSAFSIDNNDVWLTTAKVFDYEQEKKKYQVLVVATNQDGEEATTSVYVYIENANDNPPMFSEGRSTTRVIPENIPSGRLIGRQLSATDPDFTDKNKDPLSGPHGDGEPLCITNLDPLSYSLEGPDAQSFRINSTAGQLLTSKALDYETKDSYNVTVKVTDGKFTDSIDVAIIVTNVREREPASILKDSNLARTVREELGLSQNAPITQQTLRRLTELSAIQSQIKNLTGLEHATQLTTLRLDRNQIRDVSPLSELTRLKELTLGHNKISNIRPLTGLTQLESLNIGYNSIKNDGVRLLTSLTQLKWLVLDENQISNIRPLVNLTNLKGLWLNNNQIRDVSLLSELKNLETLYISGNPIQDTSPLASLTKLVTVDVEIETPSKAKAGPKIEGPWTWMIISTGRIGGAAAATSGIDYLERASKGTVTEKQIATNGAMPGDTIKNKTWTSGKLSPTGRDNITEMLNAIGLRGNRKNYVAYGSILLHTPRTQNTTMYVGSDDAVKVWLNGKLVHNNPIDRSATDYQDAFPVTLKKGENILLVAVYERTVDWSGFFGFKRGTKYTILITPVVQIGPSQRPPMYWIDANTGTLHRLIGTEVENFIPQVQNATSLTVDAAYNKIYWTEQLGRNKGSIKRANLDGSNVQVLATPNGVPRSIAVDSMRGKLYWTDSRGRIQRSNLNGRQIRNLIRNLDAPENITVDVADEKLYWTEASGRIRSANLNGKSIQDIANGLGTLSGIAISGNKIYYGTTLPGESRGSIGRANLNGSNLRRIASLQSTLSGIAIDPVGNKLYWTESDGYMWRANLNGRNIQEVVSGLASPAYLVLGSPSASTAAPADSSLTSSDTLIPDATGLLSNYPNPFNPETWIPYQLAKPADVTLTIYATNGEAVRRLVLGNQAAGVYESRSRAAYWDGRNALGEPVASGVYFYTLTAGEFTATRKMLIRK